MMKRIGKLVLALALAGFFFWLAFRNVDLGYLWAHIKQISLWWIAPFAVVLILSNVFRAERWMLLVEHEKEDLDHITFSAGVFNGYFFNLVGPRFGEISRPIYVAKREDISPSKLIGTIVVERIFDTLTMVILLIITAVYLISDKNLLQQVFGEKTMAVFTGHIPLFSVVWVIVAIAGVCLLGYAVWKAIQFLANHSETLNSWFVRLRQFLSNFKEGLLTIRKVKHWGLFILYSALIWICYIVMAYIAFWMFNMQQVFGVGMVQAVIITVVSSIGMAMPSPAGLGTYEYFVKNTMVVLFGVPAVVSLAYATIMHMMNILLIIVITPITFAIDKWRQSHTRAEPV